MSLLVWAFALLPALSVQDPGVVSVELVVDEATLGGKDAPFAECHASTLVETKPGTLVAAWFGGQSEGAKDVRIWLSQHQKSGWSPPEPVASGDEDTVDGTELYPTWNPVLFQPEKGRLLLYYKVGPSPSQWWGRVMESKNGKKWGSSKRLADGFLGPVRNKPIVLRDGTWLAGSSTEGPRSGGKDSTAQDVWRVHFERSQDQGKTWTQSRPQPLTIPEDGSLQVIQPTLLEHDDGRVQALCRSQNGQIVETWSTDSGASWEPLTPTTLPNPNAALDAVRLKDGRFLLVYNHQTKDGGRWLGSRRKLNVAISDDGIHWQAAAQLENDPPAKKGGAYPPGEYSYPAVIQAQDGLVHVLYTWRRKNLRHVVIDPSLLEPVAMPSGNWPPAE